MIVLESSAAGEIRVPAMGESVVEATVGAWLKGEGESVVAGEALVQLETEKVNLDVSAERSGTLQRIVKREGETVGVGDVLGLLGAATTAEVGNGRDSAPATSQKRDDGAATAESRPHASPVARRVAEEHGIDLAGVRGTGTGGRVTREDVEAMLAPSKSTEPAPSPAGPPAASIPSAAAPEGAPRREERVRMSRRRQTIAARLLDAQRTAAMLTTFNEVDMSAVMELRARHRESFKARHRVGLGFMSFFTHAVVGALKAFPRLNAEVAESGTEFVLKRYYDIGIAVGAEEGLVVPVLRDVDRKSFAEIEREIAALAEKARTNKLTLEDLRGGTFTITNGGVYGSLLSTPILSPPQVGILGMHRIQERPVAMAGQVVIRPMMYLALTYDHRIVDGREAVQFLVRVKELTEDPASLLLEG